MPPRPADPTPSLTGRRLLLGVCGGIAAYRACELARELMRAGASVQCVLTPHAAQFVTPLTFEALTGQPALVDEFPADGGSPAGDVYAHLNLTREIDCFIAAPLTATTMADMATGRAGNLLSACYLSNTAPVVLAPAMNTRMWLHAAVQGNLAVLTARGHRLVAPGSGTLACGDEGPGRLAELPDILAAVVAAVQGGSHPSPPGVSAAVPPAVPAAPPSIAPRRRRDDQAEAWHDHRSGNQADGALSNLRFIVTAGGTREYLDPVRFLTNASTGTLALAVVEALLNAGAAIELVASEVDVPPALAARLIEREGVRTAFDMQQAITDSLHKADGLVMFAAVADFTPAQYSPVKRKKDGADWALTLSETQDILRSLASLRQPGQVFVAVSLEDEDWLARGMKKAQAKGVDLMLAVELGADLPFGDRKLHCALLAGGQEVLPPGRRDKQEVAAAIRDWLAGHYAAARAASKET